MQSSPRLHSPVCAGNAWYLSRLLTDNVGADFLQTLGYIAEYSTLPTVEELQELRLPHAYAYKVHLEANQHESTHLLRYQNASGCLTNVAEAVRRPSAHFSFADSDRRPLASKLGHFLSIIMGRMHARTGDPEFDPGFNTIKELVKEKAQQLKRVETAKALGQASPGAGAAAMLAAARASSRGNLRAAAGRRSLSKK